jgi:hypothetical protein
MTASNRDRDIVEQLIGGASVSEIGRAHGLTSPGASLRLIDRALDIALPSLDLHQQGRVDLARLDRLIQAWWAPALKGDLDAAGVVLSSIEARTRVAAGMRTD